MASVPRDAARYRRAPWAEPLTATVSPGRRSSPMVVRGLPLPGSNTVAVRAVRSTTTGAPSARTSCPPGCATPRRVCGVPCSIQMRSPVAASSTHSRPASSSAASVALTCTASGTVRPRTTSVAGSGVQGLGAGEHVQPVTGSRYRGGRRTHLERRAVDPADRAVGTVDGVRGRRLLYHAEPVARIGDPYLCGHLRRRAVEQGQLTDPGGGQPRRAGQQVRTFGRVPVVGTGHDHTRRQYHDRETGQSAAYPIPPQPHRIPFDVLMCRSVSTARQPGYTPVVVDRWRVGAQTGTAVEGGRRAP